MQRQITFGGGVSPRNTRLRGQSIIEYVLIIAVISLVVVFAGPGVAGAIRNQLNQVTNTVDAGTDGDNFMSAEEKAYREAMKTVVSKEAKDWTLDEQKAAATDIAKNGTSSVVYAKAKAAMDAGVTWRVQLTNGKGMTYRIIGINHDDLADGSGKAGLTFWAIYSIGKYQFNSSNTNVGGWEMSELRAKMNTGEIWNLLPNDFQSKVNPVKKITNNVSGKNWQDVSATIDRLFLPSITELIGSTKMADQGYQYESLNSISAESAFLNPASWLRSTGVNTYSDVHFSVYDLKSRSAIEYWTAAASSLNSIYPAFCF